MANPFLYPQARHRRKLAPPAFKQYQQYKPTLRQEFSGQCVYCRALDRVKGYESFGVDHYRPKKIFPSLETEYLNLYYSCNRCNALKRDFWPSARQLMHRRFIPNPCEYVMFDHVRYNGGTVVAVSLAGEFTVDQLDLNDPDAVEFREGFIEVVLSLISQIRAATKTILDVRKLIKSAKLPAQKDHLENELALAESTLAKLEETRKKLLG